jgi:hypothetical protein
VRSAARLLLTATQLVTPLLGTGCSLLGSLSTAAPVSNAPPGDASRGTS